MSKRVKLVALGATAVLGIAAVYDGIKLVEKLRQPLNTRLLEKHCEYIYIKHNYFREPVKDFLNEFFQEETLIYSIIYNLKRKLIFTKVSQQFQPVSMSLKYFPFS